MNRDLYEEITLRIVASLEKGVAPWVRPWRLNVGGMDRNGETGRTYSGVNVILTAMDSMIYGYTSREWFTFNQVRKLGGHVKKGSRGTTLVFWKPIKIREADPETGEMKDRKIPLMKNFVVFNRDSCNELPPPKEVEVRPLFERNEEIEGWRETIPASVLESKNINLACYSPYMDRIEMPSLGAFVSRDAYYATLFHEMTHWTGADGRLKRGLKESFGGEAYAYEELVAELGSAFLCASFGVDGALQHPEYIGSWIKRLKDDKRLLFSAAARAREATVYLGRGSETAHEESDAAA